MFKSPSHDFIILQMKNLFLLVWMRKSTNKHPRAGRQEMERLLYIYTGYKFKREKEREIESIYLLILRMFIFL